MRISRTTSEVLPTIKDAGTSEGPEAWSSPLSRLSPSKDDEVTATASFMVSTNGDGLTCLEDAREQDGTPIIDVEGIVFVAGTIAAATDEAA